LARKGSKLAGDALAAAALESDALVFELARLQSDVATLNSRIVQARDDVRRALEQSVELDGDDLEGYERRLRAARERGNRALAVVPDDGRLTVREVAAILGTTPQTVNKWIRNGFPKTREPLWRPGAWSKDVRGANTLALRDLDATALTPIQQERLLVARLRTQRTMTNAAA
jgi:hypothetical protein